MSVAALLSHFGIHVPRYVTMDGRIVFDNVTSTNGGTYTHPSYGAVSPVKNHIFHGGVQNSDDGGAARRPWWDDHDRLALHIEAMERSFPGFTFVGADADLSPCWVGDIDTGRGKFKVVVVLRRDQGLPFVRLFGGPRLGVNAGRRWMPSPHLYLNGNLCVADSADWNQDEHTAATVVAWTAHWLAAYTEWRITRRWPVQGVQSRVA